MAETLQIAIAAGGTAGHINPAIALADELVARGHSVRFVGQPTRLEATLVPEAGYPFIPIEVTGFDRSRPWTAVSALARVRSARRVLGAEFARTQTPDVVVGFGAYVEVPLVRWAGKAQVPVVLHEQNSVPGLANLMCARQATTVCAAFPAAEHKLVHDGHARHVVVTGNPVRTSVLAADRTVSRAELGIESDATLLLVFGGSLGARHINEGVCALKNELLHREDLEILHATGRDEYDSVVQALALSDDEARRWRVVPYIDAMGTALAAADLVLSRAGASSVAEIAARAVPSILVPYPFARSDHQTTNAKLLTDAGAAVLMNDADLDSPVFSYTLLGLIDDADRRTAMQDAAQGLAQDRSAATLADQVECAAATGR